MERRNIFSKPAKGTLLKQHICLVQSEVPFVFQLKVDAEWAAVSVSLVSWDLSRTFRQLK
jgi:hypothetical protein